MRDKLDIIKSVIFGLAVGDALGVPVEFKSREYLRKNPVTDMQGYGTYNVPRGTWSDDTSMTLCTLESITKNNGINLESIMESFAKWYKEGYMTPFNECFDIGNTTYQATLRYLEGESFPYGSRDENSNGNGSLMRISPVVLFYALQPHNPIRRIEAICNVSMLTHSHDISIIGCGLYNYILDEIIKSPCKESIREGISKGDRHYKCIHDIIAYIKMLRLNFASLDESEIKSTGYVVDTLESAVWCLMNTSSFEECVLKAVNLGEDTDTVGAVAGSLAGALYGFDSIPKRWLDTLAKKEMIEKLCKDFAEIL